MQVKIIKQTKILNLLPGDSFIAEDSVYIYVKSTSWLHGGEIGVSEILGVRLTDGCPLRFAKSMTVVPVQGVVTVK